VTLRAKNLIGKKVYIFKKKARYMLLSKRSRPFITFEPCLMDQSPVQAIRKLHLFTGGTT
jgi:hypothetical protein